MTTHVTGINSQVDGKKAEQPATDAVVEALLKEETVKKETVKEEVKTPTPKKVEDKKPLCQGLDIGTMNIIGSKQIGKNTEYKRIRNVFIDLTDDQVKMLKLSGDTSYIKKDGICYVLGDSAAAVANIFGRKLRAPLSRGVISPGEIEAMEILKVMVGEVLGKSPEGGICFVSSPGDPVDSNFDALYHQAVVSEIVQSYGWQVETVSEATAMAYSEAADTDFSSLNISAGHGMTNISLVFKTIETLKFSVARGGSWIDDNAAKVCGKLPSQICAIKEKGLDLLKPVGREQQAIAIYYRHLIGYVIQNFIQKFREIQGNIEIPNEIPLIIAGGTSLAGNFVNLVKQEINKNKGFPFAISEIRQASDPLNSIAKGLLIMAQNK